MVADSVLAEHIERVRRSSGRRLNLSREAVRGWIGEQLARERAYDAETDRLLAEIRSIERERA